jgi:peptidoglycan biosynthesis protein MviN/MurJ (putative lipid II flippase)
MQRPLVAADVNMARSSAAVSISVLLGSAFGGLLALLIAVIVGETPQTDGFLAAYSAYLLFILFGTSLRVALLPIFGSVADESAFRARAASTVGTLAGAATAVCAGFALLSPLLGRALVPGAPAAAQNAAAAGVAILAVAAWCQIWSAGLASVLAASRRFVFSSMLYAAAGGASVLIAAILMPAIGVLGAAIGSLAAAALVLAAHAWYLRRLGLVTRPAWGAAGRGDTWRLVALAGAGASAPIAYQLDVSIALAALSGPTGTVTAYYYGYLLTLVISGVTSATLGLTTMPALVQSLQNRASSAIDGYLRSVSAYSAFVYVPVAAGYAAFGYPFVERALRGSLTPGTIQLLWDVSRIFLLMGLAWAVLIPAVPLALALERYRALALVSACIVALHTIAVLALRSDGAEAVAAGHAVCGALLPLLTLAVLFGRRLPHALGRIVGGAAPAALAVVYPLLAATGLDESLGGALAGLVIASALYLALAVVAWPSVGSRAVRLLLGRRREIVG